MNRVIVNSLTGWREFRDRAWIIPARTVMRPARWDFGAYGALALQSNVAACAWAVNTNSAGDNDPALLAPCNLMRNTFDIHIRKLQVPFALPPPEEP